MPKRSRVPGGYIMPKGSRVPGGRTMPKEPSVPGGTLGIPPYQPSFNTGVASTILVLSFTAL